MIRQSKHQIAAQLAINVINRHIDNFGRHLEDLFRNLIHQSHIGRIDSVIRPGDFA